jgi:hypothetical protein
MRLPQNFTEGVSIELEGIESGSTKPRLLLIVAYLALFPGSNFQYFEEAPKRIEKAIEFAHLDNEIGSTLPKNILHYFNDLGKNLKDDEQIIFGDVESSNAVLNNESRNRLQLAASESQYHSGSFEVRGSVFALDKARKSFEIQLLGGQKIKGDYEAQFLDVIQNAFVRLEQNQKIWLSGIGKYNVSDKLQSIETIEEAVLLDTLDVPSRLIELSYLPAGWLDGEHGDVINRDGLQWLIEAFETNYNIEILPLPATFPTPEGNIQFEWSINDYEASLNVELSTKKAEFYAIQITTESETVHDLDLDTDEAWGILNQLMMEING